MLYKTGAMVWLNNPVKSQRKLGLHWKGPYEVMQVMPSCSEQGLTYRIANLLDCNERQPVVYLTKTLYIASLPATVGTSLQPSPVSLFPSVFGS